jgi:spermidine synthase/tetratricopeptide (TPR) repeat protein
VESERSSVPEAAGASGAAAVPLAETVPLDLTVLLSLGGFAAALPALFRLAGPVAGASSLSLAFACGLVLAGMALGQGRVRIATAQALQTVLAGALVLSPALFALLGPVLQRALWGVVGGSAVAVGGLRLVVLALLFLSPALAAGALLRLLSSGLDPSLQSGGAAAGTGDAGDHAGRGVATGLAMAAVAVGLAAGGAFLLPRLGTIGAIAVALGITGLAAGLSVLRRRGRASGASAAAGTPGAAATPGAAGTPGAESAAGTALLASRGSAPFDAATILAGTALGAAAIAWQRTASLLAGPTSLTGLTLLVLLLLGVAVGCFVLPALRERADDRLGVALQAAAGLLIAASMFCVPWLAEACARLGDALPGALLPGLRAVLAASFLALPAAFLLGASFSASGGTSAPRAASFALGAALGAVLGASAGVPVFGLRRSLGLAGAMGLLAAIARLHEVRFAKPALRGSVSLAGLVVMVLVGGFPAAWDPRIVAGGLYRYSAAHEGSRQRSAAEWLETRSRGVPPLFYREGENATVMVEESVQQAPGTPSAETETMTVDGRAVANSGVDVRSQVLSGEIPLLLHGPADNALLIDFTLGVTAGSMLRHPIRSLTVIEREPAVAEPAGIFGALANNPAGDSRLRMIYDDPRARLEADATRYDAIVVAATDPWLAHTAGLITREGYGRLKSRLKDGGVVAQRLSLGAASEPLLRSWMRTFQAAFPSTLVFQLTPDDLLLVGSETPLALKPTWVQNVTGSNAAVADDLQRVTLLGADEIVLTLRLGADGLRKLLGEAPIDDDDHQALRVAASRDLTVQRNGTLLASLDDAWSGFGGLLDEVGPTPQAKAAYLYRTAKSYLGLASDPVRALDLAKDLEALGAHNEAHWVRGEALLQQKDPDGALQEWQEVLKADPDNLDALFSLGMYEFDTHDYFDAERYLERAVKSHGDTAVLHYNHGRTLYQIGKYPEAITELQQARTLARGSEAYPLVDYLVGLSQARLKRDKEAETSLRDYLKWAYKQTTLTRVEVDAHLRLAEVLDRKGLRLEAFKERQKADRLKERLVAAGQPQAGASQGTPADQAGQAPPPDAAPPSNAPPPAGSR